MKKLENQNAERWTERIVQRNWRLGAWTFSWVASLAIAVFGPEFVWEDAVLTLLVIGINFVFGLGMIGSFRKLLRAMDEMQRRIQLEALALAMGFGVVGGLSYSTLDITNLIPFDAEIGFVVMLMSFTYVIALVVNTLRYR